MQISRIKDDAIVRIQSAFRGYRIRKKLREARLASKFIDDDETLDNYDVPDNYLEELGYLSDDQGERPLVQDKYTNKDKENLDFLELQYNSNGQDVREPEVDAESSSDLSQCRLQPAAPTNVQVQEMEPMMGSKICPHEKENSNVSHK